jgi:hypothetical protein
VCYGDVISLRCPFAEDKCFGVQYSNSSLEQQQRESEYGGGGEEEEGQGKHFGFYRNLITANEKWIVLPSPASSFAKGGGALSSIGSIVSTGADMILQPFTDTNNTYVGGHNNSNNNSNKNSFTSSSSSPDCCLSVSQSLDEGDRLLFIPSAAVSGYHAPEAVFQLLTAGCPPVGDHRSRPYLCPSSSNRFVSAAQQSGGDSSITDEEQLLFPGSLRERREEVLASLVPLNTLDVVSQEQTLVPEILNALMGFESSYIT